MSEMLQYFTNQSGPTPALASAAGQRYHVHTKIHVVCERQLRLEYSSTASPSCDYTDSL